ncbi:MAG: hypothetical protein P8M34_02985 [Saprospiraceae bacterium]|nr:hypothetical protein [Saprospiraceae bacterium]
MKLIFDCGSTKCTIVHTSTKNEYIDHTTVEGFNPVLHTSIESATYNHFYSLLSGRFFDINTIVYCGARCINKNTNSQVQKGLLKIFPESKVDIYSDLEFLGHILEINERSIIGILGTGSNSGLWDKNRIVKNNISGGYLLGDEGSAYVLGKKLLINYLRGNLNSTSSHFIENKINLNQNQIIQEIYSTSFPNRLIASYAALFPHIDDPMKDEILNDSFGEYIEKRILPLSDGVSIIHLFGSVAYFNLQYLKPLLEKVNLQIGLISRGPLDLFINK